VNTHLSTSLRRAVRVCALLGPGLAIALAAPAVAEVPEGWSDPEPVSAFDALLVWVFLPLAVVVVVVLLASLPEFIGAARNAPSVTDPGGGEYDALDPRPDSSAAAELDAADPADDETGIDELMDGSDSR
jgi:hypothetical protein